KQAAILEAQGQSEAIQRLADAEKYRQVAVAEGEAEATRNVYRAIHEGGPSPDLVAVKYLEALVAVADGKATKIFLPTELSGLFGAAGGLAEILRGDGQTSAATPAAPVQPPS
ncbi:MAG: SPFH domain-containing protein, partial [Acidimicrobiia bacterium]